jgi:DeoR/GlpR family transcriptional regulator of sugar metabolism
VIAIVDHSKWERVALATFCRTNELSTVISDDRAPTATAADLRARGIDVRLVPGEDPAPDDPASSERA